MVRLHPYLQGREFSFKDVLMAPYKLPDFPRSEVDLSSNVTRRIRAHVPFLGAPMDTVTGYEMAAMLGLIGGIGVIHYNFLTVDAQIRELEKLKNYKAAFVKNPVCMRPDATISDVYKLQEDRGFFSAPITMDGTPNTPLLGFVTHRDVRYVEDKSKQLQYVMTKGRDLITAHRRDTLDKMDIKAANAIIKDRNLNTLIIVDDDNRPCALVTDRDIRLHEKYPIASVDENKQLYGFLAIRGAWHDERNREMEKERIDKAVKAGADCLVIDQGVVYASQIDIARYIKTNYPGVEVGIGNVAVGELVTTLMKTAGDYIDMIKVGVGPGGACITQEELGVGRAQLSAVYDCSQALKKFGGANGLPSLIADGGIKCAGDATKALAVGADGVMMGQLLAPLKESPTNAEHSDDGLKKKFRGMGSAEAMAAGSEIRYGVNEERVKVPEGIIKWLDYQGPGEPFVGYLIEVVKQGMDKLGFRTVKDLQDDCMIVPDPGK